MPAREDGLTVRSCPRCGATVWNGLVDWRKRVGFSVSHVACGSCGLTAMEVGIDAAIVPNQIQERDAQIVIAANDVEIEYVEPRDEAYDVLIGVRLRHVPTRITIEARSRDHRNDNAHAAFQALALQLAERDRNKSPLARG
jgi:hypothetical protein